MKNKEEVISKITMAIVDLEMMESGDAEVSTENFQSTIETLVESRDMINKLL